MADAGAARLRVVRLAPTGEVEPPRGLAEAVEAANGGQWPTRRGEERLRATRPRSRARFGTPPAATGSGARRATAGLGGKRAEMAAPSTS